MILEILLSLLSITSIISIYLFAQPGPIDCQLSDWTYDGKCSVNCGGGTVKLVKKILIPASNGGKECVIPSETINCNIQKCPIDCVTSEWKDNTKCSKDCDGGTKTQTRKILVKSEFGGNPCPVLSETVKCNAEECSEDCQVSEWDYAPCSKECGGGTQIRKRTILKKNIGNGKECPVLSETVPCNTNLCDVDCNVSDWNNSPCSAECGDGYITRTRNIITNSENNGLKCPILKDTINCNLKSCTIDCQVSDWGEYGNCDPSCGDGKKTRIRTVLVQPENGGKKCPVLSETINCKDKDCPPINCVVSEFSTSGNCICDYTDLSYKKSVRTVITPASNGGIECPLLVTTESCNLPCFATRNIQISATPPNDGSRRSTKLCCSTYYGAFVYQATLDSIWYTSTNPGNYYFTKGLIAPGGQNVTSISCNNYGNQVLASLSDGSVYKGNTNSWSQVTYDTNKIGIGTVYVSYNANTYLIFCMGGIIYRSTDNGWNWTKNTSLTSLNYTYLFGQLCCAAGSNGGDIIYVSSGWYDNYNNIISKDYGRSWSEIKTSNPIQCRFTSVACSNYGEYAYFTADNDYIFKYTLSTNTMSPLTAIGKRRWTGICCSQDGNNIIACTFTDTSYKAGGIYKSYDSGTTWSILNDNSGGNQLQGANMCSICCTGDAQLAWVSINQGNVYQLYNL